MSDHISGIFIGGQECGNFKEVHNDHAIVKVEDAIQRDNLWSTPLTRGTRDYVEEVLIVHTYVRNTVVVDNRRYFYFKLSTLSYLEERELLCKYFNIKDYYWY